jgi:hypothetical protein
VAAEALEAAAKRATVTARVAAAVAVVAAAPTDWPKAAA